MSRILRTCRLIIFIAKFSIFIVIISTLFSLGTITIHELAHMFVAKLYGCQQNSIIYSPFDMPSTLTDCPLSANLKIITLSGLIATNIIALILFFSSFGIIRYLSAIVFAIGAIAANIDLISLGVNLAAILLINMSSYIVIGIAVVKISLSYFQIGKPKFI